MLSHLDEGDTTERFGLEGEITVQVDRFRIESPPAQGLYILRRYVDAGDLPSHPCRPSCHAAATAADIEQFPVAEWRGENPEGELVPPLVDLEAALGIENIRRNRWYGSHRWSNLAWKYRCRFIKTVIGEKWYGGAAGKTLVKST